jgi:two-component system, NtrC family, response regulator PilR
VALPKILVVDDDEESRQLLSEVLEANGYGVGAVADGEAAREALREDGAYRIVIADLHMPKKSGLELLRHLREQQSQHHIVLMSSFISVGERQLARDLGVHALLEKPFRLSELLEVVSGLAQKTQKTRPVRVAD